MPYVLKGYGRKAYRKLHRLGIAAGVCTAEDTCQQGAEKFIEAIEKLNASMSIPDKIAGIKSDDVPLMAKHAEAEANPLYPVPKLMTRRELEVFYHQIAQPTEE